MLRWRFLLGTLIIAALVGLCWLDMGAAVPGLYLMPVVVVLAVMATRELLDLAAAAGIHPLRWSVYGGNIVLVSVHWRLLSYLKAGSSFKDEARGLASPESGIMIPGVLIVIFTIVVLFVLFDEMRRYRQPGGNLANIATGVFALFYVGLMLCFAIQLRISWGIGALAAWIITVKMGDSGAYLVGRLFGRHKLAPLISPGKTIEGAVGGLAFACLGSWLAFQFVVPFTIDYVNFEPGPWWGWIGFGLLVGAAGIFGDLAESLLKRDVGRKDSSEWLPGFGGVLDILDSLLLSAPVAWFCWASGMLGTF